jgi:hypothetical protein
LEERAIELSLTASEVDLILSFLASRPPASDESGEWTASNSLDEWPASEYRATWMALDTKLRSG